MAKIEDRLVTFYPATGEVVRENPMPQRALDTRAQNPKAAASACGIGRVKWGIVESYTKKDIADFKKRYQIGKLLATNAKTIKPRPSGRHGVIKGLNLAPHFYANLLHEINVDENGHLAGFDKRWFNGFDPSTPASAASAAGMAAKELVNLCTGASRYCRQTCLVLTGQHPGTLEASRAKLKFTYGLLSEPELFVATLNKQLQDFSRAARRKGLDAVVRLNMLSDLPWYAICPELLEAHESAVAWYDYSKLPFWRSPDYERVSHLLDLTFSFSGSNDTLCAEALKNDVRIAVVFAPADAERRATVGGRTTFTEVLESGIVDDDQRIALFGGKWPIVDGDESDYRIDDPQPSVVALNFKETVTKEVPLERVREGRAHFAVPVPDVEGFGEAYSKVRKKKLWKEEGIDPDDLGVAGALGFAEARRAQARRNPDVDVDVDGEAETPESASVIAEGVGVAMAPIRGTRLLIGPHVPTVLND